MGRITTLFCAVVAVAVLAFPAASTAGKREKDKHQGEHAEEVLEVTLIPCNEALCGVMADVVLRKGKVGVNERGDVEIDLKHGPEALGLCLEFQPWGAAERVLVGDFTTNDEGNVHEKVGVLEVTAEMGLFVVTDCADQSLLVSGFSTHPGTTGGGDGEIDGGDDEGGGGDVEQPDDPDGDGVPNVDDPDDDNDGIPDNDDPDDDNDGISDDEDANPGSPNLFDNIYDPSGLKEAFKREKKELKSDYKAALRSLKEQHKSDKQELSSDFRKRKQSLR